ncbi:tRNA splicing endonuclease subunit [Ophiocordyceps camponoti-floridani]|uniref:tRNA splicing endonuclease subunit n=1 Tax=Ophiocordyceps camponoti-floridani TaxID=2030778 RepID=A0A8H4Q4U3_9HYPO|nr:tRNA splicing endonuclease subunit [Ophiocordyceps camponoti-floridani]
MAFDDDENLLVSNIAGGGAPEDEGPEDGLPDYQLFGSMSGKKKKNKLSSQSIRKGEKDFESHGTRSQEDALEASRKALEDVLSHTRIHRPETWVRGWYFPDWWSQQESDDGRDPWLRHRVVVVEHERGSWMKDIGRTATGSDKQLPGIGRLWLLPEEALYLVERGTLDLWWPDLSLGELLPAGKRPEPERIAIDNYDVGLPLSLEAAYALLIGYGSEKGMTSLAKYQVFTHLKRAGYHVLRAPPEAPPVTAYLRPTPSSSLWQWLFALLGRGIKTTRPSPSPVGPLVAPGIYRSYGDIYRQLELLPRHDPSGASVEHREAEEPFRVHFHVWKADGAPFSKKSPPPADFRIAVADNSDSGVPTLEQLDALFRSTPWDPPGETMRGPGRLYQRIRHGHRNVLIAIVDRGLVNFMRFGEAAFGEEKLFERFDGRGEGGRGGRGRSPRRPWEEEGAGAGTVERQLRELFAWLCG